MSDRILQTRQREFDSTVIIESFIAFENQAKSKLLINCKDKFQVVIAQQEGVFAYNSEGETDLLTLDFSSVTAAVKVKILNGFRDSLPKRINQLMKKAHFSELSKDYKGAQLWKTFNSQLAQYTTSDKETQIIVLTDGYFDFESGMAVLTMGNYSTQSNFIESLRSDAGIDKLKKGETGILALDNALKGDVKVISIGLRSKFLNYLKEEELLKALWKNWLIRSGIPSEHIETSIYGPFNDAKTSIKKFFTL